MKTTRKRAQRHPLRALTTTLALALLAIVILAGTALAIARPAKPTAKTPAGTVATTRPTFKWSKAARAASYEVRAYKGATLLVKKAGVTRLSWKSSKALPKNAALTWKVRARNAAGNGAWSAKRAFKVATGIRIGAAYGGGKVAYILKPGDPGYVAGETHGLIAATADLSPAPWSNVDTTAVGTTSTALGTGRANTAAIVGQPGCTNAAARVCDQSSQGGKSDWYLPSRDELLKLYENQSAIGGFQSLHYWSSSEWDAYFAWGVYFRDGSDNFTESKEYTYRVRAVRSF